MAIAMYFPAATGDASTYASINARLGALDSPAGRLYHAAFLVDDAIHIFDVWEDEASFEAFSKHLMPLLAEHGVELSGPAVIGPVERVKVGDPVAAA